MAVPYPAEKRQKTDAGRVVAAAVRPRSASSTGSPHHRFRWKKGINETPLLEDTFAATRREELRKLSNEELEQYAPKHCGPCPVQVIEEGGIFSAKAAKSGSTSGRMRLPIGHSVSIKGPKRKHVMINTGCVIAAGAWNTDNQGCVEHSTGSSWYILALGVHPRSNPITHAYRFSNGAGSIQLWQLGPDADLGAKLRAAYAHNGGGVRCLQWLRRTATKDRVGLLLAALSNGAIVILSVGRDLFTYERGAAASLVPAEDAQSSVAEVFFHLAPSWTQAPQLLQPAAADPQGSPEPCRVLCAAATPGLDGTYLIAGGSWSQRTFIWVLEEHTDKGREQQSHQDWKTVLESVRQGSPAVLSVAWALGQESNQVLACGLEDGCVQLWDWRMSLAPFSEHQLPFLSPVIALEWLSVFQLCVQQHSDSQILMLETMRTVKLRPSQSKTATTLGCFAGGMCGMGGQGLSAWVDGVLLLLVDSSKNRSVTRRDLPLASWTVDVPKQEDDCPHHSERAVLEHNDEDEGAEEAPETKKGTSLGMESLPQRRLEHRRAGLCDRFVAREILEIGRWRPWEGQRGGQQGRGNGIVITLPGKEPVCRTSQASRGNANSKSTGVMMMSQARAGTVPLPLSMVVARSINQSASQWLVATGSLAGILHIMVVDQ